MENRYKIILSNDHIYKEIELAPNAQRVKVGTNVDCDIRLRKELFFDQIELTFIKSGETWSVQCSDGLYLTVGDIRKLVTKNLSHGESLQVKYQESDIFVFALDFFIDFDDGKRKYERVIDVAKSTTINIGCAANANIKLASAFVKDDEIILTDPSEPDTVAYGDVNEDGEVTIVDVLKLNQNLLVGAPLSEQGVLNADVDKDGTPSAADALLLLQSTIGLVEIPLA